MNFLWYNFGMFKRVTILKLNKIVSLGHLPARGNERYDIMHPIYNEKNGYLVNCYGDLINCFAHACFNLSNEQILRNNIDTLDMINFSQFVSNRDATDREIEENLSSFVNATGLRMRTCNPEGLMKSNEWKVALYLCKQPDLRDFHFFLQERDGSWSSKYGYNASELSSLPQLEDTYVAPIFHDKYHYYKTFAIENPFVREK